MRLTTSEVRAMLPVGFSAATMAHWCINGPCDLASIETRRDLVRGRLGDPLECSLILWGEATEPLEASSTRIGGWPWMGRGKAWPVDDDEKPLEHLCRLDFGPAATGRWRGVSVFAKVVRGDRVKLETVTIIGTERGEVCRLFQMADVEPRPEYRGFCVQGSDYPSALDDDSSDVAEAAVLAGTKIGGVPVRRQDCVIPSGFVAQIASFSINHPLEWPLVNRRRIPAVRGEFVFGDLGCIGVYERHGVLEWNVET
jgi:hypothetical protein